MANKDKMVARWQSALEELNLIKSSDKVEEYFMANWAEFTFGPFGMWRKGTLIFTKEKLLVMSSFGICQLDFNYEDIRDAKKCFVGLLPMGIALSVYDKKTDKVKKHKIWVSGRGKLIKMIAEKAGINA